MVMKPPCGRTSRPSVGLGAHIAPRIVPASRRCLPDISLSANRHPPDQVRGRLSPEYALVDAAAVEKQAHRRAQPAVLLGGRLAADQERQGPRYTDHQDGEM